MAQSSQSSSMKNNTNRLLQFLVLAAVYRSPAVNAFTTTTTLPSSTTATSSRSTRLFAIAEYPNKEDEKTNSNNNNNNDNDDDDSWIETNGGFLPKIPGLFKEKIIKKQRRTRPNTVPEQVMTIQEYKAVVADEKDQMVVVRFYAPWCKSCQAIKQPFRKLCRDNSPLGVKFVECPVTKDNAYLHEGLGIPSLPFGHIYHPEAGLVEERKINKHVFQEFNDVLQSYIAGECNVEYPDGQVCVPASSSSSSSSSKKVQP